MKKAAGRALHLRWTTAMAGGLLAAFLLVAWLWLTWDLPALDQLDAGLQRPSITVLDRQGRLLYEVIDPEGGRNTPLPIDEIPLACQQATVATEDRRFYSNPGFDLRALIRAAWANLQGGEVVSGGSTITQQVAKNLLLAESEREEITLRRKLRELLLAYRLTRRTSKDEILALYMNQVNYGNLAYGIDAASRAYFGRPVSDLTLAECALLAGLPQAPALYNPLIDPEAARDRQSVVLGLMVEAGYLSPEEALQAARQPLQYASEDYPIEAPHFVQMAVAEAESILGAEHIQAGGLRITTTLNLDWQRAAQRIAQRHLETLNTPHPGEPPHRVHNAALVALDPATGEVLTLLGSPDYFDESISGAINLAVAPRQPGSTLKPFTYALAMDPDRPHPWTAATMLMDLSRSFVTADGFAYTPQNYDRSEHGPVLLREALASSYNIPAVLALQEVTVPGLIRLLSQLGVTTLRNPDDYDLALTLGGGEIRLIELTGAYGALANGGAAIRPYTVEAIYDADGELLYEARPHSGAQVIDPRVAWLITDILSDNNARAPAFSTHSVLQIGRPAAAKTGTTTDFRDNWTLGYTPDLVVGVWVGNASGEGMVQVSGISGAGPIWHSFMREVLRGAPERAFPPAPDLVRVELCSLSGLLLSAACPYTRLEWFIPGTEPSAVDSFYQTVVHPATGQPVLALDLPPEAQDWARSQGLTLVQDLTVLSGYRGGELAILEPGQNSVYRIDAGRPIEVQQLRILLSVPAGYGPVTLRVDGGTIAVIETAPYEAWWTLQAGRHRIEAEAAGPGGAIQRAGPVTILVNR